MEPCQEKAIADIAKVIIFPSTTPTALPVEINSGGTVMTKRTTKSVLAVFEYCVKAALLASKEGFGEIQFIGEIPVCYSMYDFWNHRYNCDRDIKKFMALTEDIPNNIEKYLSLKSTIRLVDEE